MRERYGRKREAQQGKKGSFRVESKFSGILFEKVEIFCLKVGDV